MKDPAFLFYSSDFLTGTICMTDEQVGIYIRLLCLQHQKGHLSEKDMLHICKTYDEDIFAKFVKDADGKYYNERCEFEIKKRKSYSESRSKNRKGTDNQDDTSDNNVEKAENNNNISKSYDKSYVKHMENENENENINENINKSKKNDIDFAFCENSELKPILIRWLEYKKWKGQRYKGQDSVETMFKKLCEYSNNDPTMATEIIEDAIAKNYTGFFKPTKITQNGNTKTQSRTNDTTGGIANSALAEFLGVSHSELSRISNPSSE